MKRALIGLFLGVGAVSAQNTQTLLTPAVIEARGERSKFVDCAKFYGYNHGAEFTETNVFFYGSMMAACDPYLEKFLSLVRQSPDFSTDIAMVNLAIGEAVADAKDAATKAFREIRAAKK